MEISKESHDELMYNKLQKIKDKLIQDQENTSKQRELLAEKEKFKLNKLVNKLVVKANSYKSINSNINYNVYLLLDVEIAKEKEEIERKKYFEKKESEIQSTQIKLNQENKYF